MNSKLLHTPDGVRDIYDGECARKLTVQNRIGAVFHCYGYEDIQTPTFEFFDIFNKERGSIASKNMYKFFDREGNTLVLRPDITPSIARCVSKYYDEETMPVRLCYSGNIFINNSEHQGKLKESTQQGIELIGDGSIEANAEILAVTVDALLHAGLKDFQIDVGQANFFCSLLEEAELSEDEIQEFCGLVERKSYFGIEDFLENHHVPDETKEILMTLPERSGSIEMLEDVKKTIRNENALYALTRLEILYHLMELYGYERYINFDIGMVSHYQYYTGIIFHVYTYGTGEVIATGGRYDGLLKQFGKDRPAVGMCISVDQLMAALERQRIAIPVKTNATCILYRPETIALAIQLASLYRRDGEQVELLSHREGMSLSDYKSYCERRHLGGILYLDTPDTIQILDRRAGTVKSVRVQDLLKGDKNE